MYLNKISIKNIRSISEFEMKFSHPAGWHVILGDNGAGKSTVVRAIALGIVGPIDSRALRLNLTDWVRKEGVNISANTQDEDEREFGSIEFIVKKHDVDSKSGQSRARVHPFNAKLSVKLRNGVFVTEGPGRAARENIWSNTKGWFSCAFGPFRRFTGGEKEWLKVYYSDPRAAAHLSVFGEDVALTEAIDWLKDLHIKSLENARNQGAKSDEDQVLAALKKLLNEGNLLPHGAKLHIISSEGVFFEDGNGVVVDVAQLSDGYRSILSLTFELIRQMVKSYSINQVFKNFENNNYTIDLPGVVIIDEIDAHLHPTWQTRIGQWFTRIFPKLQFIVTTHSPLVCRAAENGSIWRLKAPGSEAESGEVTGVDKDRLLYGDVLDAYGTELFGRDVSQSGSGQQKRERLAELNKKSFKTELNTQEKKEYQELKTFTSKL